MSYKRYQVEAASAITGEFDRIATVPHLDSNATREIKHVAGATEPQRFYRGNCIALAGGAAWPEIYDRSIGPAIRHPRHGA